MTPPRVIGRTVAGRRIDRMVGVEQVDPHRR
jgi:hypothetical protein